MTLRRTVLMLAITTTSMFVVAAAAIIVPAATAFSQISELLRLPNFPLDLTTLPIIIYRPSIGADIMLPTPSSDTTIIIIGSGPIPATDVFLKLGDIRGE
jgi:hypothetical protein